MLKQRRCNSSGGNTSGCKKIGRKGRKNRVKRKKHESARISGDVINKSSLSMSPEAVFIIWRVLVRNKGLKFNSEAFISEIKTVSKIRDDSCL
jgi:hypothetical protein